jgi:hypothetical protein
MTSDIAELFFKRLMLLHRETAPVTKSARMLAPFPASHPAIFAPLHNALNPWQANLPQRLCHAIRGRT